MNNESENAKTKENDKTSESESYEDEAMENSLGGSGVDESSFSEIVVSVSTFRSEPRYSKTALEEKATVKDGEEDEKKKRLMEKWYSVCGRRPKNFPLIKITDDGKQGAASLFGDRRPAIVEKERKQRWMDYIAEQATKKTPANYGSVVQEIRMPFTCAGLWCLRYHPNKENVAIGFRNGGVQIRDFFTGEVIWNLKTFESSDFTAVRSLKYNPNDLSKIYVAGSSGSIQIFDLEAGEMIASSESVQQQICCVDFSADGLIMAVVGRNGLVCLVDTATLKVVSQRIRPDIDLNTRSSIDDEYHRSRVYSVKFNPDNQNYFATGGWDRNLKIWDVRVPGAIISVNGPYICGDSIDIMDNTILTGSWMSENSVKLYDFFSGRLIHTVQMQSRATKFDGEFLYTCHFFKEAPENTADRNLIAVGGSGFNEVAVLRVTDGRVLATFPAYKAVTSIDSCNGYIAYGGKESLLRLGLVNIPPKHKT